MCAAASQLVFPVQVCALIMHHNVVCATLNAIQESVRCSLPACVSCAGVCSHHASQCYVRYIERHTRECALLLASLCFLFRCVLSSCITMYITLNGVHECALLQASLRFLFWCVLSLCITMYVTLNAVHECALLLASSRFVCSEYHICRMCTVLVNSHIFTAFSVP